MGINAGHQEGRCTLNGNMWDVVVKKSPPYKLIREIYQYLLEKASERTREQQITRRRNRQEGQEVMPADGDDGRKSVRERKNKKKGSELN